MNDPVRPSSLFGSGMSASAPSGVLATISNPPPDVARLPSGTILRGVVLGEDGKGHVLVRTELGVLQVATKMHPALGSEVTLQIRSSGAQLHVLLMQNRSQPAAGPVHEAPAWAQPGSSGTGAAAPHPAGAPAPAIGADPPDPLSLGQTVKAVLQTPAGGGAPDGVPAMLVRLAPGSALQVRVLAVQAPPGVGSGQAADPIQAAGPIPPGAPGTPAGATAQAQPPGGAAAPPTGVEARSGPAGAATAPALAPTSNAAAGGTGAAVAPAPTRVTGVPAGPSATVPAAPGQAVPAAGGTAPAGQAAPTGPTGAGPAAGASNPAGGATPGPGAPTLAAPGTAAPGPADAAGSLPPTAPPARPGGVPVIGQVTSVTHAGHPVLATPLGTMTLEVQAALPPGTRIALELPAGALPEARAPAATPIALARAWPALDEAIHALRELAGPGGGLTAAPDMVPQAGPKLASGMLFFLSALSGGNLVRWLGGPAERALKAAGRDGLLSRLGQDFAQMGRMAEGAGADWRLFAVPLWDGQSLRQLRLFLRHKDRRPADREADATRFILEVEMSRLGEMQFDGLVRAKRFDLILRTRQPLPEAMRADIRRIFADANEATGYAGSLGFQASRDWHFLPIEEPGAAAAGLVV